MLAENSVSVSVCVCVCVCVQVAGAVSKKLLRGYIEIGGSLCMFRRKQGS